MAILAFPLLPPFRLRPRRVGKLRRREGRVVATFGGRVYRVRRRFDLSNRDQFTWPSGAAGDLLIFKYVSLSVDRSFLIAAASPSVSRVPEDWKINVKNWRAGRRRRRRPKSMLRLARACDGDG